MQSVFKSTAIPKENSGQVLLKEMKMQSIAINIPKTDQRNVCLRHKYGTVSEQDFREHEKRKEESRQKKKNDKKGGGRKR